MGGGSAGGAGGAGSGAGLCTLQMPLGSEVLFLHLLFLPFSPLTFTLHCLVGFKGVSKFDASEKYSILTTMVIEMRLRRRYAGLFMEKIASSELTQSLLEGKILGFWKEPAACRRS